MVGNSTKTAVRATAGLVVAAALAFVSYVALSPPSAAGTAPAPTIGDVTKFLERCPASDPAYAQIRADFEIRRDGAPIADPPCTEPVSAMPIAQYTDELIAVQALRVIYHMEGGRQVDYPWTPGSLYDWMKSQIGGINLESGGSYCCQMFNNRWSVVLSLQNQWERDADRKWQGISGQIALIAHETRHVQGYGHVGGCPTFPTQTWGCDQTYNESNIGSYGIEWWLNAKWLSGDLNVGYSCPSPYVAAQIGEWHMDTANRLRGRFVDVQPPVLTMPSQPGGPCLAQPGCPGDTDCDGWSDSRETALATNPLVACPATAQADDEPVDAWPPDVDDNRTVNIMDVGHFVTRLGSQVGDANYLRRYDLDLDGRINTVDIGRLVLVFGTTCV